MVERLLDQCRHELGDDTYEAESARGGELPLAEVVEVVERAAPADTGSPAD